MLCVNILYLLWIHQSLQKYKHFFSFLQTIKLLCTSYKSAQWWVLQNGYEHYFITITYTWNWLGKALLFLYILDKINFFASNWTRKTSIFHFRIIVFSTHKNKSQVCWEYASFAWRYYEKIKWCNQTFFTSNSS